MSTNYQEEVFSSKEERDARYIELTITQGKYGTYKKKNAHVYKDTTSIIVNGKGPMVYRVRWPINNANNILKRR